MVGCVITIALNINLVIRTYSNKSKQNDEMRLFYYRFILDICFGSCLFPSLLYLFLYVNFPETFEPYRNLIITLSLPWSNLAACRSIIALSITTDRVLAAYFPIAYRTGKFVMSTWIILMISVGFGLSEELVLFEFCGYELNVPVGCKVLGCAVNQSFYRFWTLHKTTIFLTLAILSILLSIRLLLWTNDKNTTKNSQITKANRLALLDTIVVLIFDFSPSFLGSLSMTASFFSFEVVGPYIGVCKATGCAIEAIIVSTFLISRKPKQLKKTIVGKASMSTKNTFSVHTK
ncbi:unnamed protein product [Caenorhabditis nigoni]